MASYPGPKVHRTNRRKLGRGQFAAASAVTTVATHTAANVVTLTFSRPVVVTGVIPSNASGNTFVSQQVSSGTAVLQTFSGNVSGSTFTMPSNPPTALSYQGGAVVGTTATF